MAETYCGKECGECSWRESLGCPGCKTGPGKQYGGDCGIAACCRLKNHETCDTCTRKGSYCVEYRSRDSAAQIRKQRQEREKKLRQTAERNAMVLGKYLWVIFWLIIAYNVGSLVEFLLPWLGRALEIGGKIALFVLYIRLAPQSDRFQKGGIYGLVTTAAAGIVALLNDGGKTPGWTMLLSILASIFGLLNTYHLYTAHSDVLCRTDAALAENWLKLWKWQIAVFCVTMGSRLLIVIVPLLGLLCVMVGALGTLVVGIFEIIYLYRTAKVFRAYGQNVALS